MAHSSTLSIATTAIDYTPDVLESSGDTTSSIPGSRTKSEDSANSRGENNIELGEKTTNSNGSIRKDGEEEGSTKEEYHEFPVLTRFRSIMLVFVMSSAMILNVSSAFSVSWVDPVS